MLKKLLPIRDNHAIDPDDPLDRRYTHLLVTCWKYPEDDAAFVHVAVVTATAGSSRNAQGDHEGSFALAPMLRLQRKKLRALWNAEWADPESRTWRAVRCLCRRRGYHLLDQGDRVA
jgi:hypothetical protein